MYQLTFTMKNGTTRNDFDYSDRTIEAVRSHYETMIRQGQNSHSFMGREFKDCVSVVVEAR